MAECLIERVLSETYLRARCIEQMKAMFEIADTMVRQFAPLGPMDVHVLLVMVIKACRATYGSDWEDTLIKALQDREFEHKYRTDG